MGTDINTLLFQSLQRDQVNPSKGSKFFISELTTLLHIRNLKDTKHETQPCQKINKSINKIRLNKNKQTPIRLRNQVFHPHPPNLPFQESTSGWSSMAPSTPSGSRTWIPSSMTTRPWPWLTATGSRCPRAARSSSSRRTSTTRPRRRCPEMAWWVAGSLCLSPVFRLFFLNNVHWT